MSYYTMSHPSRTIIQLFKHCRNLIWKGRFVSGRISRGEYWLPYLMLVVLSSAVSAILRQVAGDIGSLIASIIGIVLSIFQIKLIIKRSHDINESAWYSFVPVFVMVGIGILSLILLPRVVDTQSIFTDGEAFEGFLTAWPSIIAGVLLSIAFVRFIRRSCKLIFRAGTKGENTYGQDPLLHQPASNQGYWIIGSILVIISIIISAFGQPTVNKDNNTIIDTTTMDAIEGDVAPQS